MGRLLPDFRYRYVKFPEEKVATIKKVLGTRITNRIQIYLMLLNIILVGIGGFLANEFSRSIGEYYRLSIVVKLVFVIYLVIVTVLTFWLIYVLRDRVGESGSGS